MHVGQLTTVSILEGKEILSTPILACILEGKEPITPILTCHTHSPQNGFKPFCYNEFILVIHDTSNVRTLNLITPSITPIAHTSAPTCHSITQRTNRQSTARQSKFFIKLHNITTQLCIEQTLI